MWFCLDHQRGDGSNRRPCPCPTSEAYGDGYQGAGAYQSVGARMPWGTDRRREAQQINQLSIARNNAMLIIGLPVTG